MAFTKTTYCIHHEKCDLSYECITGHFCPFFKSIKTGIMSEEVFDFQEIAEETFDAIWEDNL